MLPAFHHSMCLRAASGSDPGQRLLLMMLPNDDKWLMCMLYAAHSSCHACALRRPWRSAYLAVVRPDGAQLRVSEAADVHFGPGRGQEIEGVEGVASGTSQMLQRVVVHDELRIMLLRAQTLPDLMLSTASEKSPFTERLHARRTLLSWCMCTRQGHCTRASRGVCTARF